MRELEKGTVQKTQSAQGCKFIRADIIRQWHEMRILAIPDDIDLQGMVDDPEASGSNQSSQFKQSNRPFIQSMPQAANLPVNPTLTSQPLQNPFKRGGKKTRRRQNRTTKASRRHK